MTFIKTIQEDYKTHREGFLAQGFWALQIYRFGHLRHKYNSKLIRAPIYIIHLILNKLSEILFGISIGSGAKIGRRMNIEHFGCIVIHGKSVIGDDCMLRQGVTIGNRYLDRPYEAPVIGHRVVIGAGAKILGNVVIGDDVVIGANAVVLKDVPGNSIAVGVPAKVIIKD